jgi:glycyl-tRNA synthetase beta chain
VDLLKISYDVFQKYNFNEEIISEIYKFILTRLYNYLVMGGEFKYSHNVVQSIITTNPDYLEYLPNLLIVLDKFSKNKDNQALFSANKRIENILKKINNKIITNINQDLFQHDIERELYQLINESSFKLEQFAQIYNWQDYFNVLSSFNKIIGNFFDSVMIMDEDLLVRENRINLLVKLYFIMNKYCKLSELSI